MLPRCLASCAERVGAEVPNRAAPPPQPPRRCSHAHFGHALAAGTSNGAVKASPQTTATRQGSRSRPGHTNQGGVAKGSLSDPLRPLRGARFAGERSWSSLMAPLGSRHEVIRLSRAWLGLEKAGRQGLASDRRDQAGVAKGNPTFPTRGWDSQGGRRGPRRTTGRPTSGVLRGRRCRERAESATSRCGVARSPQGRGMHSPLGQRFTAENAEAR